MEREFLMCMDYSIRFEEHDYDRWMNAYQGFIVDHYGHLVTPVSANMPASAHATAHAVVGYPHAHGQWQQKQAPARGHDASALPSPIEEQQFTR